MLSDPLLPGQRSGATLRPLLLAALPLWFLLFNAKKKKQSKKTYINKLLDAFVVKRQLTGKMCVFSPTDSSELLCFCLQNMEVVEAWMGRNFSRRNDFSLHPVLSTPVIFFLSTFFFSFLKKSGISTSLLSHSPWHCGFAERHENYPAHCRRRCQTGLFKQKEGLTFRIDRWKNRASSWMRSNRT